MAFWVGAKSRWNCVWEGTLWHTGRSHVLAAAVGVALLHPGGSIWVWTDPCWSRDWHHPSAALETSNNVSEWCQFLSVVSFVWRCSATLMGKKSYSDCFSSFRSSFPWHDCCVERRLAALDVTYHCGWEGNNAAGTQTEQIAWRGRVFIYLFFLNAISFKTDPLGKLPFRNTFVSCSFLW